MLQLAGSLSDLRAPDPVAPILRLCETRDVLLLARAVLELRRGIGVKLPAALSHAMNAHEISPRPILAGAVQSCACAGSIHVARCCPFCLSRGSTACSSVC